MQQPIDPYVIDGPIALVPKDSPEYAWRVIKRLQSIWSVRERYDDELALIVERIEQERIYDRWPIEKPYGSLEALVQDALGEQEDKVLAEAQRLRLVRPAMKPGRPRGSAVEKGSIRTISKRGTQAEYGIARLKRDRPDLADRVIAGELSVNQAAIEAGFRTKTATVPADPQGIAKWARKHFTAEQIAELVEALR